MTLDELTLAPQTRLLLANTTSSAHHALLLHGAQGTGLRTIANSLAGIIGIQPQNVILITPETSEKEIPVSRIRELYSQTKSSRNDRLLVLIDDADMLSLAAQNTLLKLLEEPPSGVMFILTSHDQYRLLPTIRSRVMDMPIHEISPDASNSFVADRGVTGAKQSQIAFLASGRPAELQRLIDDSNYFEAQVTIVKDAKAIATGDTYTKLSVCASYAKDRLSALQLVRILGLLYSYNTLIQKKTKPYSLLLIAETLDELRANANPRVTLLRLAVEL